MDHHWHGGQTELITALAVVILRSTVYWIIELKSMRDNGCAIMVVMSPVIGAIQVLCNAISLEI